MDILLDCKFVDDKRNCTKFDLPAAWRKLMDKPIACSVNGICRLNKRGKCNKSWPVELGKRFEYNELKTKLERRHNNGTTS